MFIRNLSRTLTKISSTKLTVFSGILFSVFIFIVLPVLQSKVVELFSVMGLPDLIFHYTSDKLYKMASAYGELGRNGYIKIGFQFDLIWPVVYTFFLITSISWFSSRTTNIKSKLRFCNLLPIAAFMFDLLENLSVSIVMYLFPIKTVIFSNIASYATTLKWLFVYANFIILVTFLIAFLVFSIKSYITRNSR